jgi:hypothetical protein
MDIPRNFFRKEGGGVQKNLIFLGGWGKKHILISRGQGTPLSFKECSWYCLDSVEASIKITINICKVEHSHLDRVPTYYPKSVYYEQVVVPVLGQFKFCWQCSELIGLAGICLCI